jgi:hypothetical protein
MKRATSWLPSSGRAGACVRMGLAVALCSLPLSGCGSAAIGLQKDGTYILENSEKSLECDRLYKAIWGHIQIMKKLPERAKAEMQTTPTTAFSAIGRIFGVQNKGLSAIDEYDREAAHVDALNRAMVEKGCARIQLERELADTEYAIAQLRGN